jgi:transglutaminase-like putative cysteine protease
MIYHVTHTTTYTYSQPVSLCHNLAHLNPRPGPRQASADFRLIVDPDPAVVHERVDFFGNLVTFFTVQEPHKKLAVRAEHTTTVQPYTPPDAALTPPWDHVRDRLRTERTADALDAYHYAFDSPYVAASPALLEYAAPSFPPGRPLLEAALDLTARIHREFRYDPKATTLSTSLAEVLAGRRGVCQDFAHLEIGCLRSLGLAARYVSGYLLTRPAAGKERLVGADASHAWVSVYCPGFDWIDLDPTNDLIPSDEHILLAWGRDYDDVSPVKGVILGGGDHTIKVAVDVVRVESPEQFRAADV